MTSTKLCFCFLFVAVLQFEQVIGVSFRKLNEVEFNNVVSNTALHPSFSRGPMKFKLNEPWLVANIDDFFVIIFSCDCNSYDAPCSSSSKTFYTFIRMWKYDAKKNNPFLVIDDDMGLGKPIVNVDIEVVRKKAGEWLNGVSQKALPKGELLRAWQAKAADLANFSFDQAKDAVRAAYEYVAENSVPCTAAILGLVYSLMMQGPDNPVHRLFSDLINNAA